MTLSDEEALWLVQAAKRWRNTLSDDEMKKDVTAHIQRIEAEIERPTLPLELLIICPRCKEQHIDEGRFAVEPHKNHSCQHCGLTFQASGPVESIGVQFFRGYKNGYSITPIGKPSTLLPSLRPGEKVAFFYKGQAVRFKEAFSHLGYDTTKEFFLSDINHTGEGTMCTLRGESGSIRVEHIEPARPEER